MSSTDTQPAKEYILETVIGFPPNFDLIQAALPQASRDHTYCYGDKIYNPSGKKLPIDIQYHEYIHSQQQALYDVAGGPDLWWNQYLMMPGFRLQQELEAYGEQYKFAKEHLVKADEEARANTKGEGHLGGGVNKILKQILFSMAHALSGPEYGSLLSFSAAESAIKKYGKN